MSRPQTVQGLSPEVMELFRRVKARLVGAALAIDFGGFPIGARGYDRVFPEEDPEGYLETEFTYAVENDIFDTAGELGLKVKPGGLCQFTEFRTKDSDGELEEFERCAGVLPSGHHLHVVYQRTIRPTYRYLEVTGIILKDTEGRKVLD